MTGFDHFAFHKVAGICIFGSPPPTSHPNDLVTICYKLGNNIGVLVVKKLHQVVFDIS